jgi:hypothetical protein
MDNLKNQCQTCQMPTNSPLNVKVSLFKSVQSKFPEHDICLGCWLQMHHPTHSKTIQKIRNIQDADSKRELKKNLPAITPAGTFENRHIIKNFSGLYCLDIDGNDNPQINNWESPKKWMIALPFVVYCGLSASGKGLLVLIKIPDYLDQKDKYPNIAGAFMQFGLKTDNSKKGGNDLRYYSWDPEPYTNHNARSFNGKFLKYEDDKPQKKSSISLNIYTTNTTSDLKQFIKSFIASNTREFDYREWIELAMGLANELGEDGRELFHKLSEPDSRYEYHKCDKQYSEIMKRDYTAITGGTIRYLLK